MREWTNSPWKSLLKKAVHAEELALAACDQTFDQADRIKRQLERQVESLVSARRGSRPQGPSGYSAGELAAEAGQSLWRGRELASALVVRLKHSLQEAAEFPERIVHIVDIVQRPTHGQDNVIVPGATEEEETALLRVAGSSMAIGAATIGVFLFPPVLAAGVVTLGLISAYVLRSAWKSLREGKLDANSVNALIAVGALLHGAYMAAALAIWFSTLLEWLVVRTRNDTRRTVGDVLSRRRQAVWLHSQGTEILVELNQVEEGDLVAVHAGESVPVDGVVIRGAAVLDLHILTGETLPAERGPGESVLASSLVLSGKLLIRVVRSGARTTAAQLDALWRSAETSEETLETVWQKKYERLTPSIMVLSVLLLPFRGLDGALAALWNIPGQRMVAFAPLSLMTYVQLAAKSGILVRDGMALDRLHTVDTVVFDKTGTLTEIEPELIGSFGLRPFSVHEVLQMAAAAEQHQSHPIARAIRKGAETLRLRIPEVEQPEISVGFGVSVTIDGDWVHVGSERFLKTLGIGLPRLASEAQRRSHRFGQTVVFVVRGNQLAGWITLAPKVRAHAVEVVEALKARGIQVMLVSGDHEIPTRYLAEQLGIDHVHAQVLPQEKCTLVQRLQEEGRRVCFVGDGINDIIALKTADVSVTFAHASPTAMEAAQIILIDEQLKNILSAISLSEEMVETLERSSVYAVIPPIISLIGTVLFGWGLALSVLISQIASPFGYFKVVSPLIRTRRQADMATQSSQGD